MEFNFQTFDRQGARLVRVPELTIQAKGTISMNRSAWEMLGSPLAVQLLMDPDAKVIGLRPTAPEDPNAYPCRPVGGGGGPKQGSRPNQFIVNSAAFMSYWGVPVGNPVRREVKVVDGVLIIDLNDPGRSAMSNRNRAKLRQTENDDTLPLEAGDVAGTSSSSHLDE